MTIRTRFAPSPTGTLHIGNVRTALFAWLYARQHNGQFVLRIEDTDSARSTAESAQAIVAELQWLGLDCDVGPLFQSERHALYQEAAERLLSEGHAYRCYCTKEELAARAAGFSKGGMATWGYDGKCRERTQPRAGVDPVVRIRTPDAGVSAFDDCVHGPTTTENRHLSDIVIVRADGTPTYNFAAVVDDIAMQITHVLRGADHLQNTFQQINLIEKLGAAAPTYAHLPMVLREDGQRLSKRDQSAGVARYRARGYLPQALLNYLARLGWSKGDQEIFSIAELIEHFDLAAIHKSAAALNPEKLDWLNAHYMAELPIEALSAAVHQHLAAEDWNSTARPPLTEVVAQMRTRYKTTTALAEGLSFIYKTPNYAGEEAKKHQQPQTRALLKALLAHLEAIADWDADTLKAALADFRTAQAIKMAALGKPLRFILTANAPSPALGQVMEWIGKDACLARLKRFTE